MAGKIKKLLENELVGGTQSSDVYPVTSVKAIYDEDNERLDGIINRRGVVNISTNYNSDHTAEVFTLEQAIAKVPSKDRVLGFQGKFLTSDGWKSYIFTGDSLSSWSDISKWIEQISSAVLAQELGDSTSKAISQKAVTDAIAKATINTVDLSAINLDNDTIIKIAGAQVPIRYVVTQNGKNAGVLSCFSDNMGHMLTQVFTTHYMLPFSQNSHSDEKIFTYFRSYHISGGTSTIPTGTWGEWTLVYSSDNQKEIDALNTAISNLNSNTGISDYEEFSDQKEYKAGTTVLKDGLLKTFIKDHAAGAWDNEEVEDGSLKKEIEQINSKMNVVYNQQWILGYYIDENGGIIKYKYGNDVGYIEIFIENSPKYIYTNAVTGKTGWLIIKNSSDSIIGKYQLNYLGLKKIYIPNNSYKILVTNIYLNGEYNESNPYISVDGELSENFNTIYKNKQNIEENRKNINIKDLYLCNWIRGYYINSEGNITKYTTGDSYNVRMCIITDFIGNKIITDIVTGLTGYLSFVNSENEVIEVSNYNTSGYKEIEIPDGTVEIRLTNIFANANNKNNNPSVAFSNGLSKSFNDIGNKIIKKSLDGKILSVIGTSISTFKGVIPSENATQYPNGDVTSFEKTWIGNLLLLSGMSLGVLQSWAGSRVTTTGGLSSSSYFVSEERWGSLGNPDIIIVEGGTNDLWQENAPNLGDIPDIYTTDIESYDKNDFAPAYLYLLMKLREKYPNAVIYCLGVLDFLRGITSPYFKNNKGWSKQDLDDIIKKCCDIVGCHFISQRNFGVSYYNFKEYAYDGDIHPNATLMSMMANNIFKHL